MPDDLDLVFHALADPTRRTLIDKLRIRAGLTLGEMAEGSKLSRFGVMKHLAVLESAGLVSTERAGRLKLHYLDTGAIAMAYDQVIAPLLAHDSNAPQRQASGGER